MQIFKDLFTAGITILICIVAFFGVVVAVSFPWIILVIALGLVVVGGIGQIVGAVLKR